MNSKILKEFEVNLIRLKDGENKFEFELNSVFFNEFPDSLIKEGQGRAFLTIEKSETMLRLEIQINLEVMLLCDVSLESFVHQIDTNQTLIIKFGEEDLELSEDVLVIKKETQFINVADFIYEFTNLLIPMKKIHPKLRDKDRPDLVYVSDEHTDDELKKLKK
jgi:uncharacterized metal-binding protein YceD (DUF177 family)